jgi:hypothetical protein
MLSRGTLHGVDTWYDYRRVWAGHPLLLAYALVVVAVLVLAVVGTVLRVIPLAILFIPALAGAYAHHLMAMKRLG